MTQNQKVASKTLLYTVITILLGYALLKVPVVGFIVECLVLFIAFNYLYEMYGYIIFENEKTKLNKKPSKKKGKK